MGVMTMQPSQFAMPHNAATMSSAAMVHGMGQPQAPFMSATMPAPHYSGIGQINSPDPLQPGTKSFFVSRM